MASKPKGSGKNGWGGARAGAGRPKKAPEKPVPVTVDKDMLELLQDIALGKIAANTIQVRAAIAAVQYTHAKKGEGGKKEAQRGAAEKAANKFVPKSPPKLVVNNTRRS